MTQFFVLPLLRRKRNLFVLRKRQILRRYFSSCVTNVAVQKKGIQTKNSMAHMLGQIPEVLLEQIISYLSIDDWAKIDSLLFNHDIRIKFHSALKSMLLEEISTKEWLWNQSTKNSALQWVIARGINVRSVVVQTNTQVRLSEIEFPA